MMFKDKIINAARQTMFVCKKNSIAHVGNNCFGRFLRRQVFVRVHLILRLVFYKEHGIHGFAHIVEERADARLQGIRTDGFSSLLGQVSHL